MVQRTLCIFDAKLIIYMKVVSEKMQTMCYIRNKLQSSYAILSLIWFLLNLIVWFDQIDSSWACLV